MTVAQLKKWEAERIEYETKMSERLIELVDKEKKLELIEAYADLQLLNNAGMRPKIVLNILHSLSETAKNDD